ncbi:hypothetical protein [Halobaculum lipolyticum]|uniref:hypothetical protein n=1 Tax=Halobaculum lipolyticum TaxID=3032001 RepID=UPI0024C428C6|nr:hypothetical protein [Halobaculum sp. DT31]
MSRPTVLLVVAALVLAGVPATAAFAQESAGEQPGAAFAGVVGVQGAEVEGEVQGRALGEQFAAAETNESKAAVVASQSESIRGELADLRERRETLRERYEAGDVSRGEYRAKLARIVAQTESLRSRLNTTAETADGLPEETLRERGVNASAIAELRRNASEMTDGEAAAAARDIAGEGVGAGLAGDRGPPADRGPPEDRGRSDDATENATETEADRGPPEDRVNAATPPMATAGTRATPPTATAGTRGTPPRAAPRGVPRAGPGATTGETRAARLRATAGTRATRATAATAATAARVPPARTVAATAAAPGGRPARTRATRTEVTRTGATTSVAARTEAAETLVPVATIATIATTAATATRRRGRWSPTSSRNRPATGRPLRAAVRETCK